MSDDLVEPYENTWTVEGRQPEIGFTYLSIPSRLLTSEGQSLVSDPVRLYDILGATEAEALLISELPWNILDLLLQAETGEGWNVRPTAEWLIDHAKQPVLELFAVAEYLTFADVVTFELSDTQDHSLAQIATASAGRVVRKAKNTLSWVGAGKLVTTIGGPKAAALGVALTPFAVKLALGITGVVLVADPYGVVAGIAKSERTRQTYEEATSKIRQVFKRLTTDPGSGGSGSR